MKKFFTKTDLGSLSEADREIYREQYEVEFTHVANFALIDVPKAEKILVYGADRDSINELTEFIYAKVQVSNLVVTSVKLINESRTFEAECSEFKNTEQPTTQGESEDGNR